MQKLSNIFVILALVLVSSNYASAQNQVESVIQAYLSENIEELGVSVEDVISWEITDNVPNSRNGSKIIHIVQTRNGLPLKNGVANFTLNSANEVVFVGNRLIANIDAQLASSSPKISSSAAISLAASDVKMVGSFGNLIAEEGNNYIYEKGSLAQENISVSLGFWKTNEGISLVWQVSLYQLDGAHWWQVFVDADSKKVVKKIDWVTSCDFGPGPIHDDAGHEDHSSLAFPKPSPAAAPPAVGGGQYNVFPLPVESPIHGSRSLVIDPADSLGSPFGWHDDDGLDGADYTYTRGNNVFAYTDFTNNNTPDTYPDGGVTLDFDFFLNLNQNPAGYRDVAVTNLFFTNNRIHDIFYHYGFDESNGNFQENNYSRGGVGSDFVNAEAQDGGGTNNANFATPGDGFNPRMQMYLWGSAATSAANLLSITSPSGLAGSYTGIESGFGPPLTFTPITADIVVVSDGTADSTEGCGTLVNGSEISGNIAIVRRGNCSFTAKVENAQTAGAVAVIIVNNGPGLISPGGANPVINIPSIMISQADGNAIIDSLLNGNTVSGTLVADSLSGANLKDGDFDNGIIVHEYGHGISNRMTGGPFNSNCLSNDEQMGEGWSDFFTIMLTIDSSATNQIRRPIGTYATGATTSGGGIRNAPYDTSFSVNSYTYDDVNNTSLVSQPHGVGFVWATMLWDLNWALIDQYGFDADLEGGSGGNNIALQLVVDGLALQACNPGFVDGRDAILLADRLNNNGANQCLIWKVFARRGLGYSASQGSSFSRTDQVEAFDLPPICQTPTSAPVADFTSNETISCSGLIEFTDMSTDVPQRWLWNFGDGNIDSVQNPVHMYTQSGTYSVSLEVTNTLGGDTLVKTSFITVAFPTPPISVIDGSGCSADSIVLSAVGNDTIGWFDASGKLLGLGNSFKAAPSLSTTTYYARSGTVYPKNKIGPQDGSVGSGGYHGGQFTGTVNFDAEKALTIYSAWVDAGSSGFRTFTLWDAYNGQGNIIQTISVNIPSGAGRIDLGFEIPAKGSYSIGLNQANLFRNDGGANYPYSIPGLLSLTGSSAQSGGDYYYYLYDLEVSEAACWSDSVPVFASISDTADFSYTATNLTFNFTDLTPNANSWSWDFGDGNTSTVQNPVHTYSTPGIYTVSLSVDGGVCVVTYKVGAGVIIGIDEEEQKSFGIKLFPNPAAEVINLSFSESLGYSTSARIYTTNGKLYKEVEIGEAEDTKTIRLDGMPANLYVLEIELKDGTYRQKVIVIK